MLLFDKMKIAAPLQVVKVFDKDRFVEKRSFGEVISHEYKITQPSEVSIRLDYNHNEFVIAFTGKVLGDSYPSLINKNTFFECLRSIETIGGISLDKEGILNDGQVIKCDVTCDVQYSDMDGFIRFIKANLSNFDKWEISKYTKGIKLQNKVVTDVHKKRLVIYNKEKEMQMASHKRFLDELKDRESLLSYFKGKTRFERNLTTKESIRKALNIQGTSVLEVLNSSATPIGDVLKEAVIPIEEIGTSVPTSVKDFQTLAVLKQYNFDLTRIEATLRAIASKNTRMSRLMKPYKEYVNHGLDFDFSNVLTLIT